MKKISDNFYAVDHPMCHIIE